jgi:hypothetical protein
MALFSKFRQSIILKKLLLTLCGLALLLVLILAGFYMVPVSDKLAFRGMVDQSICNLSQTPMEMDATQLSSQKGKFSEAHLISSGADVNKRLTCPMQSFKNGDATYDVAFLEFNDSGLEREPAQMRQIENYVKAAGKLNVLIFVHGWRHDASVGDEDVRRFHTLTSLTANYTAQRVASGQPATKTLGIFVGWRGAYVQEFSPDWLATGLAGLSILKRKPASDDLANPIGKEILKLESLIKGDKPQESANRLIIYGHSLGGNMVLKGLTERFVKNIESTNSKQVISGVGDLVVLFNPASEASNFVVLQKAMRSKLGIKGNYLDSDSFLGKNECEKADPSKLSPEECNLSGTSKQLSRDQMPILISLTSAKYFESLVCKPLDWDTAVGNYFPLMQRVKYGMTHPRQDVYSVGNLLPVRVFEIGGKSKTDEKDSLKPQIYGLSHEIEIDSAAQTSTTYALSASVGTSTSTLTPLCPAEREGENMLTKAMKTGDRTLVREWDTNQILIDNPSKFNLNPQPSIQVNIRHGAARHRCGSADDPRHQHACKKMAEASGIKIKDGQHYQIPTLGEARDPFWNVGVHPNAIDEHGGYVSHTLWCVLNRIALDKQ